MLGRVVDYATIVFINLLFFFLLSSSFLQWENFFLEHVVDWVCMEYMTYMVMDLNQMFMDEMMSTWIEQHRRCVGSAL